MEVITSSSVIYTSILNSYQHHYPYHHNVKIRVHVGTYMYVKIEVVSNELSLGCTICIADKGLKIQLFMFYTCRYSCGIHLIFHPPLQCGTSK